MAATVQELADLIRGTLRGDGSTPITDARSLSQAEPGHITFVEHDKQARLLAGSQASAAVVSEGFPDTDRLVIRVADPLAGFITIVQHLRGVAPPPPEGVDPRAAIHPSVILGPGCGIQPFACVGEGSVLGARCRIYPGVTIGRNCKLGDDVTIYAHAVLYDGTTLGDRVTVHANAVLGADGFGYRLQGARHVKVPQLGRVEIGDDVEIGACSTIDRAAIDTTRVGAGTKIDNLVQIAHNCQIGPHNLIVAQVGIAGSSSTGSHVILAGQVGVVDHIHIGDRAMLGARSAANANVPAGARYLGQPAVPEGENKRMIVHLAHLGEMRRDLQRIKRHLGLADEASRKAS